MKGLQYWQREIAEMGYPELPLTKVSRLDSFQAVDQTRLDFFKTHSELLKHVGHHAIQECFNIHLMREQILKLQNGIQPENTTIMFKIPPEYGGQLNVENLFLIQTHPYADTLYSFLQMQYQEFNAGGHPEKPYDHPQKLYAFTPKGNVFIPSVMGLVSPGGINMTDRMSEINAGERE